MLPDSIKVGDNDLNDLKVQVNEAYESVVYWRKNLFELPKGKNGKEFVNEMTIWIDRWSNKTKYRNFAFKALSIMPNLLLQRTSQKSKSHENKNCLERRLKIWKNGNIIELLKEAKTIQDRLPKNKKHVEGIDALSKRFRNLMLQGNVKGALRLLESETTSGILPINEHTINLLHEKTSTW